MNILRNEKGIALITALMFTLICLGMIMTLLYYVLAGTRMSAAHKTYRSSLEASYGGTDFMTKSIIPRLFNNYSAGKVALQSDFRTSLELSFSPNDPLKTKLYTATSLWPTAISKTLDPKESPDATFNLQGTSGSKFKVYTKIVDTVPGVGLIDGTNIDYLDAGLAVAGTSNSTQTPRTPNIYSIEIQGEAALNPKEKAALSVLYAY